MPGAIDMAPPPLSSIVSPFPVKFDTPPRIAKDCVLHAIATLRMASNLMLPDPLLTVQICAGAVGCVLTVMLYDDFSAMPVNRKLLAGRTMVRSLPPLFWSTNPDPSSPEIVPSITRFWPCGFSPSVAADLQADKPHASMAAAIRVVLKCITLSSLLGGYERRGGIPTGRFAMHNVARQAL